MIMKTIYNPSDKNITNYPVSEAQVDANGNIIYDKDDKMLTTVRTLTWNIGAGETVKLPAYVADHLLAIYGFLKEIADEKVETTEPKGGDACKLCGRVFKGAKAKALHYAAKHPELLP